MQHVYPVNDIIEHELSLRCKCKPVIIEPGIVLHNAMDGRVLLEKIGQPNIIGTKRNKKIEICRTN